MPGREFRRTFNEGRSWFSRIGIARFYAYMMRLEDLGLLTGENREGSPERGGYHERWYTVTDDGRRFVHDNAPVGVPE